MTPEITTSTPELNSQSGPDCRHWWLLDPPNGTFARGVCKLYGTVSENTGRNSIEDFSWFNIADKSNENLYSNPGSQQHLEKNTSMPF